MDNVYEGGCLCGAVRYRVQNVFDVVFCHCKTCRRRTGSPVALSVVVPKDAFELLEGRPSSFRASEVGKSYFCDICGAPLYFMEDSGPCVSLSHGSLDKPELVVPKAHQWTGSALPWFHIDDHLPSFSDDQLTHPDHR